MRRALQNLKTFNRKIERLERSGFSQRFLNDVPNVMAMFEHPHFEMTGDGEFTISGRIRSWVPDYNEDEIDAVVLAYRMLTQNNDRISLSNLATIYNSDWMPSEGTDIFNPIRDRINDYLDSMATVEFPDGQITIRTIMDVIIYGGLAHSNAGKERIYNAWMASGASGFFQVEFMAALRTIFAYFSQIKDVNAATIEMLEDHFAKQSVL